jgi:hypothetical protein
MGDIVLIATSFWRGFLLERSGQRITLSTHVLLALGSGMYGPLLSPQQQQQQQQQQHNNNLHIHEECDSILKEQIVRI